MKEIDQLVELHRAGEINDAHLVKGVLGVFEEYQHAREIGIDVPPVEPWAKRLQDELDDARGAWYAEQNRLKLPAGMTWGTGTPSYALAIGPGIAFVGFGIAAAASAASGVLQFPQGWRMPAMLGLMSGLALILCIWYAVKAGLYRRGQREYDVQRTRIILRNCQSRDGAQPGRFMADLVD